MMQAQDVLQICVGAKADLMRSGAYNKKIDEALTKKILETLKHIKITTKQGA